MPSTIGSILSTCVAIGSLAAALNVGEALAGVSNRRVVPFYPDHSSYAPYYYSRWNPYSLYSIYDHLSGGRQFCYLPTEPCDNNHRMQN
jgi:hypothetical protein